MVFWTPNNSTVAILKYGATISLCVQKIELMANTADPNQTVPSRAV